MRYLRRLVTMASLVLIAGLIVTPIAVSASFNPFSGVDCTGDQASSAVCTDKNSPELSCSNLANANQPSCTQPNGVADPITGPDGIISKAVNIVALVTGMASVILVIVGGIRYITSTGDSGKITESRKTIEYALIGLAVVVVARTLIIFVVGKIK